MSQIMGAALLSALPTEAVFDWPSALIASGDTSLEAYYRMDDAKVVRDGDDLISQLTDHTLHGRHATQGSALLQALYDSTTYSRPVASFFAAQQMVIAASLAEAIGTLEWTVWSRRKLASTSGNQCTVGVGSLGGMAETIESLLRCIRQQGASLVTDGAATLDETFMVCSRFGLADHMYVNGVEVAVSAPGSQGIPSGASYVGALLSGLFHLDGDVSEIGVMSRALSGTPGVGNPVTGELACLWRYAQAWYA